MTGSRTVRMVVAVYRAASVLLVPAGLTAQQTGTIVGQVTAEDTAEPLSGASVAVRGTALGALTNAEGAFLIPNLPAGRYTLVAWHADRGEKETEVTVPASGVVRVELEL